MMGEAIADTLGRNLKEVAVYGREGIPVHVTSNHWFRNHPWWRYCGEHTVMFIGEGERVEVTTKPLTV